jgi:hypothetical protein
LRPRCPVARAGEGEVGKLVFFQRANRRSINPRGQAGGPVIARIGVQRRPGQKEIIAQGRLDIGQLRIEPLVDQRLKAFSGQLAQ